jgi:mitotic spindle assembly checkpoint protein MAD1
MLAEREVGFLNALVVLNHIPYFYLSVCLLAVYVLQASFNAEEANRDGAVPDTSKAQRIQQLETLLQEFKDTNAQLSKEIDALGGDSTSLGQGQGRNREALSLEIEQAQQIKAELQKCTVPGPH